MISKSRFSASIRVWLLDIYQRGEVSPEEALGIASVINDFINKKETSSETSSDMNSNIGLSSYNLAT
jgi:hypothetical protein